MLKFLIVGLFGTALTVMTTPLASAQATIGFGGDGHDSSLPVEVTSDTLRIDQDTGQATFVGNVLVVQGNLRMNAAQVEVKYTDDQVDREISEVVATGDVLITQGDDAAEGSLAVYDVATGSLTMTGDVLVTQGSTLIAGEQLVVDMETGDGTMEGRVRTTFDTTSEPTQ